MNAVYPNGDNMRDIPDYTEFVPEWVWRYYQQSGDKATLGAATRSSKAIAKYLQTNTATTRQRRGPDLQPVRRDQLLPVRDHRLAGADALRLHVHQQRRAHDPQRRGRGRAARGGGAAPARSATPTTPRIYGGWADSIAATMNAKLIRPDGLYTDGLSSTAGNPQIDNTAEHAQTYPLYYGIAPAANRAKLLDKVTAQGMKQGPMTWHVLLKALADGGRYDQVVKLLTDPNADGPAKMLDQQGTYMWEQWNPGCAHVAVQPDQQRVDVARLGLVGHRGHGRGAARRPGDRRRRLDGPDQPPAVEQADLHRVSAARPGHSAAPSAWPGRRSTAPTSSTSTSRPTRRRRSRSRTRTG